MHDIPLHNARQSSAFLPQTREVVLYTLFPAQVMHTHTTNPMPSMLHGVIHYTSCKLFCCSVHAISL